ncbi:hypothetical protein ABZ915_44230 [Streptomyces sp. NPDC046915]|uniref:hypothetical protein n=1 Tax=Streptomyces sp. NPDC046915 TaxID=3155257 RepID=UPI003406A97E
MDLTSIVTPGAQSLVAAILADGWQRARSALAARWSRGTGEPQAEIERRLDEACPAPDAESTDPAVRRALLQAHWTAFLLTAVTERPELLDVVRQLGGQADDRVHNTNSGTVTTLVQSRDIHGGITFGNSR